MIDLEAELTRTQSDYVLYKPQSTDGSTFDTGNEHILVFDAPDGSMMAVWTQSSFEDSGDHRIVIAKSLDDGNTWSNPQFLAGCRKPGEGHFASWAFPIVTPAGAIYVFYNQYTGVSDVFRHHTGTMQCIVSRDAGQTWSTPSQLTIPPSIYDDPNPQMPPMWIVWQTPTRLSNGKWYVGFTRWISDAKRTRPHNDSWTASESVIEFMQFDNMDQDPEPADVKITFHSGNEQALRVPHYSNPMLSIAQEPSLVVLPDERLFCVMRTMAGYIWYAVSDDMGQNWCSPRPLLRKDHGKPILEPLCCCPIYQMANGDFMLLHHNNDGRLNGCTPEETGKNRRPAYIAKGQYRPNADQPIWFSESVELMDNQSTPIGPLGRLECGVYPSFSTRNGQNVLWHPDRKFFLLGKIIPAQLIELLRVPE